MSTYFVQNPIVQPFYEIFTPTILGTPTSTTVTVLNSDGTRTTFSGGSFTFVGGVPTGGSATTITRTSADGLTTLEVFNVTGVLSFPVPLVSFWNAAGSTERLDLLTPGFDHFAGSAGSEILSTGAGRDTLVGNGGNDTLNGGDGNDTVWYQLEAGSSGVIVNLSSSATTQTVAAGTFTVGAGQARDRTGGTDTLIGIEVVRGTNQADALIGSAGNDTLFGQLGADYYDGGDGIDTILFGDDDPLVVTYANGSSFNGSITGSALDTFINVERIIGTNSNDVFNGNDANNIFGGGAGADTFNGGSGSDTVDFYDDLTAGANDAVNVNLGAGTAIDGSGAVDTLNSIENIVGTPGDDTITGDGLDNFLSGMEGLDQISGGGGNDTIDPGGNGAFVDGGAGIDAIYFGGRTIGAGIDLGDYTNVENAIGTEFGDIISGDDAGLGNTLWGMGGNDTMSGGAANDTLFGGVGNDNLVGNQDNDFINGGVGDDYAHGGSGNDTLVGEDGNDRLDGGLGADTIDGGAGSDILIANQGNDSIVGGADGDYMHGGQDNDTLQGGDGNDVLVGGVGSDSIDGGAGFDGSAWVGLRSAYTVTNNGGGSWTVANISTGDTDAVTGVEFLVFDDQIVS